MASPCRESTGGQLGCWSRTCTSGKAPSGSPGCACWITTNQDSGKYAATTTTATRGARSVTMATDIPAVGKWQLATVNDIRAETPRVKTFRLALTYPSRYLAGQHYSVKLTAPDG